MQTIVNPSREDRRFHGDHPGLRRRLDPGVQFAANGSDHAFLKHAAFKELRVMAERRRVH
jgi:hypothetical protein